MEWQCLITCKIVPNAMPNQDFPSEKIRSIILNHIECPGIRFRGKNKVLMSLSPKKKKKKTPNLNKDEPE